MQFKTDVENEYFVRDNSSGEFKIEIEGRPTEDYTMNLWNGTGNLTAHLPEGVKVGDTLKCKTTVNDETLIGPFINEFSVVVEQKANPSKGGERGKRKPSEGQEEGEAEVPSALSLPDVKEVRQPDWVKHSFDKFSGLKAVDNGEGGFDFFVNMDNVYLLTELKNRNDQDPKLLEAQYKYAMVLIALALLKKSREAAENKDQNAKEENGDIESSTRIFKDIITVTSALSTIIIPMIVYLGELELEGEEVKK